MIIIRTKWYDSERYILYTFFYRDGRKAYRYETDYTIEGTYFTEDDNKTYKDNLRCLRSSDKNYCMVIQKFNEKGKMIKEYKSK